MGERRDETESGKLWGGRFEKGADPRIEACPRSLPFVQRRVRLDLRGSIAHCRMLGRCAIIPAEEAERIEAGLREVEALVESGAAIEDAEDIHTWVEQRLRERIGPLAGKLHTARSRNDQVATDTRLYLLEAGRELDVAVASLQEVVLGHAAHHLETVLPGYTHMQHAQPVTLAHHLLAYFWMLDRDRDRLADCRRRADVLPLGGGALAGTPFPIDRASVARELGFAAVAPNSLDAVSDRDFVIELAAAIALMMVHLSRFGEEMVLWSTREWGFVELDNSVATGSSIMPQKKNPDVAELVRGKSGRCIGNLVSLLATMKGLPLAYNSDMQEDKERIFDSLDTALPALAALRILLETCRFRVDRMRAATRGDFSTATDLADYLVRCGVPFREAHETIGQVVRACEAKGQDLEALTVEDLMTFSPHFAGAPADLASVDASVRARRAVGGTAPEAVERQLEQARAKWEQRLRICVSDGAA